MGYAQELAAARTARLVRLSQRAPAAGLLVMKPRPIIILLDREGRRLLPPEPVRMPKFPPLPPRPRMPVPLGRPRLSVAQVAHVVAGEFGLSVESMLDRTTRLHHICRPRQVAMYVAMNMIPGMSLPKVGRRMGGFDHTTVLHAKRAVSQRLAADAELAAKVDAIRAALEAVAP